MSIWGSTADVRCLDYGHSGVHPWESGSVRDSESRVDFAWVHDYVYDHDAAGEKVMPYLRMSLDTPESFNTVVLTEAAAKAVVKELTKWLEQPKKRPRRRPA